MKETASCPGVGLKASPGKGLGQRASQQWPTWGGTRGANRWLGRRRAGLPGGLAQLSGGTITTSIGNGASARRADNGRRLPRHPLVEDVLRWRLHQGLPVCYGIKRQVVPGWGSARGGDPSRLARLADVEGPPHGGGRGDEGDDAHSVRCGVDCGRSRTQGQRPFGVADRPSVSSSGGPRRRWALCGQLLP